MEHPHMVLVVVVALAVVHPALTQSVVGIVNSSFPETARRLAAAGLVSDLDGLSQSTIFAPIDSAWATLVYGVRETYDRRPDLLATFLRGHVVPQRVDYGALPGRSLVTLEGRSLAFSTSSPPTINGMSVGLGRVAADRFGSNGVVHSVDLLLLPHPPGVPTKSVERVVEEVGGLYRTLREASGAKYQVTVMVPSDAAWRRAFSPVALDVLRQSPPTLRAVLEANMRTSYLPHPNNITATDGIVHLTDEVLLPQGVVLATLSDLVTQSPSLTTFASKGSFLLSNSSQQTIFAPTDEAFTALLTPPGVQSVLARSPEALDDALRHLTLPAAYPSLPIPPTTSLLGTTLNPSSLSVLGSPTPALNGILYRISSIPIPPGSVIPTLPISQLLPQALSALYAPPSPNPLATVLEGPLPALSTTLQQRVVRYNTLRGGFLPSLPTTPHPTMDGPTLWTGPPPPVTGTRFATDGIVHTVPSLPLPMGWAVPQHPTVRDVVSRTPALSTFYTLLQLSGLEDTLSSSVTRYTVFAPTNSAFARFPPGTVEHLKGSRDIIRHHVVSGTVVSLITSPVLSVRTTLPGDVAIGGGKVGGKAVVSADVPAGNGVVQILDGVLTHPSIPVPQGTVADVLASAGYTDTAAAVRISAEVQRVLQDDTLTVTFFAPTNSAWRELVPAAKADLLGSISLLTKVLRHTILTTYCPTSPCTATNMDGITQAWQGAGGAPTPATNGIIHPLPALLIPPGVVLPTGGRASIPSVLEAHSSLSITRGYLARASPAAREAIRLPEVTYFAPDNAGWKSLPTGVKHVIDTDPAALTTLLTFLAVPNRTLSFGQPSVVVAATASGDTLRITPSAGRRVVVTGADGVAAEVITADLAATNGVVHVLNRVPLPPSLAFGDMVTVAASLSCCSAFAAALPSEASSLTNGTLFVTSIPPPPIGDNLAKVMAYHVSPGFYGLPQLSGTGTLPTLHLPLPYSSSLVDGHPILQTLPAANGVVHVIEGILVPPDLTLPALTPVSHLPRITPGMERPAEILAMLPLLPPNRDIYLPSALQGGYYRALLRNATLRREWGTAILTPYGAKVREVKGIDGTMHVVDGWPFSLASTGRRSSLREEAAAAGLTIFADMLGRVSQPVTAQLSALDGGTVFAPSDAAWRAVQDLGLLMGNQSLLDCTVGGLVLPGTFLSSSDFPSPPGRFTTLCSDSPATVGQVSPADLRFNQVQLTSPRDLVTPTALLHPIGAVVTPMGSSVPGAVPAPSPPTPAPTPPRPTLPPPPPSVFDRMGNATTCGCEELRGGVLPSDSPVCVGESILGSPVPCLPYSWTRAQQGLGCLSSSWRQCPVVSSPSPTAPTPTPPPPTPPPPSPGLAIGVLFTAFDRNSDGVLDYSETATLERARSGSPLSTSTYSDMLRAGGATFALTPGAMATTFSSPTYAPLAAPYICAAQATMANLSCCAQLPSLTACQSDECLTTPCGVGQDCLDQNTQSRGDFVCTCRGAPGANRGGPALCTSAPATSPPSPTPTTAPVPTQAPSALVGRCGCSVLVADIPANAKVLCFNASKACTIADSTMQCQSGWTRCPAPYDECTQTSTCGDRGCTDSDFFTNGTAKCTEASSSPSSSSFDTTIIVVIVLVTVVLGAVAVVLLKTCRGKKHIADENDVPESPKKAAHEPPPTASPPHSPTRKPPPTPVQPKYHLAAADLESPSALYNKYQEAYDTVSLGGMTSYSRATRGGRGTSVGKVAV